MARSKQLLDRLELFIALFVGRALRTDHGDLLVDRIQRTPQGLKFVAWQYNPRRFACSGVLNNGEVRLAAPLLMNELSRLTPTDPGFIPDLWLPRPTDPGIPVNGQHELNVAASLTSEDDPYRRVLLISPDVWWTVDVDAVWRGIDDGRTFAGGRVVEVDIRDGTKSESSSSFLRLEPSRDDEYVAFAVGGQSGAFWRL